jgi:hypothetical protein
VNTITEPHDPQEAYEFSKEATHQLEVIAATDNELAGRILTQIEARIATWDPGNEDGDVIRRVASVSRAANFPVYRLKFKPEIQQWRVFFFLLNARRPPVRLIAELVEFKSEKQCYDNLSEPHMVRIKREILQAQTSRELDRTKPR